MTRLCCRDHRSALNSLVRVLDLEADEIIKRLRECSEKKWIDSGRSSSTNFERWITQQVCSGVAKPTPPFAVHYFHGTRVIGAHSFFDDGLLPTAGCYDKLLRCLQDLARSRGIHDDISALGFNSGSGSQRYWQKIQLLNNGNDLGPHGTFCLDSLLDWKEMGFWNYTDEPEIVAEICGALPDDIGTPLLEEFKRASIQYIVEFRETVTLVEDIDFPIETLVNFVFQSVGDGEMPSKPSYGFDGRGKLVPAEDILSVEPLDRVISARDNARKVWAQFKSQIGADAVLLQDNSPYAV